MSCFKLSVVVHCEDYQLGYFSTPTLTESCVEPADINCHSKSKKEGIYEKKYSNR